MGEGIGGITITRYVDFPTESVGNVKDVQIEAKKIDAVLRIMPWNEVLGW